MTDHAELIARLRAKYRCAVNEVWRRPESEVELRDTLRRMNRTRPYDRVVKARRRAEGGKDE